MNLDAAAAARIAGLVALLALPLFVGLWLRHRHAPRAVQLAALTALTLFLTFDLIVFGAFTRLSDSGLGCPDWPGCYGGASPLAAHEEIRAAEAAQPTGPVTHGKAWIEMTHRYLAMVVGLLAAVLALGSVVWRRQLPHSIAWPLATLAWVIVQGLFGRYTVTLKLFPAIVTLHLLGGLALLALLAAQHEAYRDRPIVLGRGVVRALWALAALVVVQAALGGWVSTNYAVLACRGFPACNGQWWPPMDFGHGFTLLRELGRAGHGGFLPFEALVAIQMVHRLFALVVVAAALGIAAALWRHPASRRHGLALAGLIGLQIATGLSNVVLDWPLIAALGHTAGAALLVALLTALLARGRVAAPEPTRRSAAVVRAA